MQQPEATLEALAQAARAGDHEALLAIHARLSDEIGWAVARARRRLEQAPSLDGGDLQQEVWLALAEAVRRWRPERQASFQWVAVRAVRRALQRVLRGASRDRARHRGDGSSRQPPVRVRDSPDATADADPNSWADRLLARQIAARLGRDERSALLLHAVAERSVLHMAADLGLSRRTAGQLLRRAHLRARALAGSPPPPGTPEARVLAAVAVGCQEESGLAPAAAWIADRTGLGRRSVRAVLRRLGDLGYLQLSGLRWRIRNGVVVPGEE